MAAAIKQVNIAEIKIKIVLTGGGTGGHIYPLISVQRALTKMASRRLLTLESLYLGPDGFSEEAFKSEGVQIVQIVAGKLRRYFSPLNFLDIFKVIIGFFQSLYHLWKFMPDLIFSKGGYGALPVVLAGWLYRIPVFIHESDTMPGLSNKISAKFAKRIGISFNQTFQYFPAEKTALVGNPTRFNFSIEEDRESARDYFGFLKDKPLLLALGGSQGAQQINDLVLEMLEDLVRNEIQVFHQTGQNNFRQVAAEGKIILEGLPDIYAKFYQARGFFNENDYALALATSDLVIGRAGSGTIFELSAAKKPAILIPLLESAGNHQKMNALEYARAGAAVVLEEPNILPHLFAQQIIDLIKNKERMASLANRANLFFQQDSSEKIASEIFDLLKIEI